MNKEEEKREKGGDRGENPGSRCWLRGWGWRLVCRCKHRMPEQENFWPWRHFSHAPDCFSKHAKAYFNLWKSNFQSSCKWTDSWRAAGTFRCRLYLLNILYREYFKISFFWYSSCNSISHLHVLFKFWQIASQFDSRKLKATSIWHFFVFYSFAFLIHSFIRIHEGIIFGICGQALMISSCRASARLDKLTP